METFALSSLEPGRKGRVKHLLTEGRMRRRLQDIGLIEGTGVECLFRAFGGETSAYLIRGAVIALRAEDGNTVLVEPV